MRVEQRRRNGTRVGEGRAVQGTDAQADSCSGVSTSRAGGLRVVRAGQGPREGPRAIWAARIFAVHTFFLSTLANRAVVELALA